MAVACRRSREERITAGNQPQVGWIDQDGRRIGQGEVAADGHGVVAAGGAVRKIEDQGPAVQRGAIFDGGRWLRCCPADIHGAAVSASCP